MIIIPDIHGRSFWKEAIKGRENEKIIFLGDYMDPYVEEDEFKDLTLENYHDKIIGNLKEILEFKKAHMDNVVLLIGNHDGHYFMCMDKCSRYERIFHSEIEKLFRDNIELFKLVHVEKIGEKVFVFTHAGMRKLWLYDVYGEEEIEDILAKDTFTRATMIADLLNSDIDTYGVQQALGHMSAYRGGYESYGSILWADIREFGGLKGLFKPSFIADMEIFGHTQLIRPIVTEYYADIDCRRAFSLNDEGVLCELDGTPVPLEKYPEFLNF